VTISCLAAYVSIAKPRIARVAPAEASGLV